MGSHSIIMFQLFNLNLKDPFDERILIFLKFTFQNKLNQWIK